MRYCAWLSRAWLWIGRKLKYPSAFDVVRPFVGVAAISGAKREFKPGERLMCEMPPIGSIVTFQSEKTAFVVERSVFEACCRWWNPGA